MVLSRLSIFQLVCIFNLMVFISWDWSNLAGKCGILVNMSSDDLLWSSDDSAFAMESETIYFFFSTPNNHC